MPVKTGAGDRTKDEVELRALLVGNEIERDAGTARLEIHATEAAQNHGQRRDRIIIRSFIARPERNTDPGGHIVTIKY